MKFDIDAFDFEFCEEIHEQIGLIDSVLKEIDEPPIAENIRLDHDRDSAGTHYLRFWISNRSSKCMPFFIHFLKEGLRIDLFYQSEAAEWNIERIRSRRNEIEEFIVNLLTSYVVLETAESIIGGCRLVFFDENGQFVRVFLVTGIEYLSFLGNYERELFFPIFSK